MLIIKHACPVDLFWRKVPHLHVLWSGRMPIMGRPVILSMISLMRSGLSATAVPSHTQRTASETRTSQSGRCLPGIQVRGLLTVQSNCVIGVISQLIIIAGSEIPGMVFQVHLHLLIQLLKKCVKEVFLSLQLLLFHSGNIKTNYSQSYNIVMFSCLG